MNAHWSGHWVGRWIGTPWVPGVSDCWSLARRVWAEEFGRHVGPLPVDPSDPRAGARALSVGAIGWARVAAPVEGDGVLMARGRHPCHVGIWVAPPFGGDGYVLHALERTGTICQPAGRISEVGYRVLSVLRRPEWSGGGG